MVRAEQVAVSARSIRIACARCEVLSCQTRVTTIEGHFHGDDYSRPKCTAWVQTGSMNSAYNVGQAPTELSLRRPQRERHAKPHLDSTCANRYAGNPRRSMIAAIVSVLTTRYIVKHGPNYDARFKQMHETLEALARTQDELKQQQAKTAEAENERHLIAEQKAAARWKPSAGIISLIEGNRQVNKLSIQSPEQFVLVEAYLLSDRARLHDYQVLGKYGPSVGLNVIISHESLLKIAK
jgi:hypothetical protein